MLVKIWQSVRRWLKKAVSSACQSLLLMAKMWWLDLTNPHSSSYSESKILVLGGGLEPPTLRSSGECSTSSRLVQAGQAELTLFYIQHFSF